VADVIPLPHRPPDQGRGELAAAAAAFLDHADLASTTRRVYHASLAALVDGLGPTARRSARELGFRGVEYYVVMSCLLSSLRWHARVRVAVVPVNQLVVPG
jgi:hypothetical protein